MAPELIDLVSGRVDVRDFLSFRFVVEKNIKVSMNVHENLFCFWVRNSFKSINSKI